MNLLSQGVVVWDLRCHLPDVHEVVSLAGDIRPMPDLKSGHSSRSKAFIEDTTYKDGILHPIVSVILQSAEGGFLSTVQDIRRGTHSGSAFKLRWHKAADMHLGRGIDKGDLGLTGNGRDDRVHSNQFVAKVVTPSVIDGDDLPSFGSKARVWLRT